MRIMMIRHPISEMNVKQVVKNNQEGKIHIRGYDQINELAERIKIEEIDHIYSSDSERCKKLSWRLGTLFDLKPEYSPMFREINNGDWSRLKKEEMNKERFGNEISFRPPNGESLEQLSYRAKISSEYIQKSENERVVLVSHGWFLKAFLGRHMGLSPKDSMQCLKFSNCAISEIDVQENKTTIEYLNNRDFLYTR